MINEVLLYISVFIILTTLIPLIRNDYWIFRVFEYARLQKLVITIILLAAILFFSFPKTTVEMVVAATLFANALYLLYLIFPFTPFSRVQIIRANDSFTEDRIKIVIANVYQDNKRSADYHKLIEANDPDVILMVETNLWWQNEMDSLSDRYSFQVKVPLENTYGMLLYSRLPFESSNVNYLVEKDIPSIEATVVLRSGQRVKLFCLHPEPPVPQENPRTTERDKEILMVAKKAKQSKIPVIVMGDLNDVAWSYTTELFGKVSGLLDPRRGRGFYNSFSAKNILLRFPLDHIFCSSDFTLVRLERLDSCGSDHFPMFVDLVYQPAAASENNEPNASADDLELAKEKMTAPTEKL